MSFIYTSIALLQTLSTHLKKEKEKIGAKWSNRVSLFYFPKNLIIPCNTDRSTVIEGKYREWYEWDKKVFVFRLIYLYMHTMSFETKARNIFDVKLNYRGITRILWRPLPFSRHRSFEWISECHMGHSGATRTSYKVERKDEKDLRETVPVISREGARVL